MKTKQIILGTLLFSPLFFFSQVGINTSNPQGSFHVDGAKDNPATGAPDATQQSNDLVVTSTGNVGIGKTVPSGRVEITSDNLGGGSGNDFYFNGFGSSINPSIFLGSARGTAAAPDNLQSGDLMGGLYFQPRANGGFPYQLGASSITSIYRGDGTSTLSGMYFGTSGSNKMILDEIGHLAVGTANTALAGFRLVSNDDDVANELHIDDYGGTTNKYNAIRFHKARGTEAAPSNLVNGDYIGAIEFIPRFNNNANTYGNGSGLGTYYEGDGTNNLTSLRFFTSSSMPVSGERMRINQNGNVGVATTAPVERVDVNGAIAFTGQAVANKTNYGSLDYASGLGAGARILSWGPDATTNGIISFWTGFADVAAGEKMRIHSNGNVGIGTSAPNSRLDLGSSVGATTSDVAGKKLAVYNNAGGTSFYGLGISSNTLQFHAASASNAEPQMVLTNTGNVGIGTSAPSGRVEIVSDNLGGGAGNDFYFNGFGSSVNPSIFLGSARGTAAAPVNLQNGDLIGGLYFQPRINGGFPFQLGASSITSTYRGNGTNALSSVDFGTSGSTRMTLDENGNIAMGTTTPFTVFDTSRLSVGTTTGTGIHVRSSSSDLNGLLYLEKTAASSNIDQFVFFRANGADIGSIVATGASGIVYNTTSDMRLKENIKNTHYGIADVMKIQVSYYNYKQDKNNSQTGYIAQQLYTIFPNAVTVGGTDISKPWMVDYGKVTPLLTKAIQDQQMEIDALRTQVDELKEEVSKISQLKEELNTLKAMLIKK